MNLSADLFRIERKLLAIYDSETILEKLAQRSRRQGFQFRGRHGHAVETDDEFEARTSGIYLDARSSNPFGAIWCNHVPEHQWHLQRFCQNNTR